MVAPADGQRKKIAAICSTYSLRSHADNFVTRFLKGYWIGERFHPPSCDVASLYVDQIHRADISERLAMAYGIERYESVAEALTLGTGSLAVDGVLLILERGDYPLNERHQKLYPRFEYFEQMVEVFRHSGRGVPVFVDKHLSYDWPKAQRMYGWSRELEFPLMAGSSLPVTFRVPELDFPLETDFEEALVVGGSWFGESWLIHLIEALQGFVERRRGGETGIRAVQMVNDIQIWRAALAGRWDRGLLDAALACRRYGGAPGVPEEVARRGLACFIEYRDGFKATALALGGGVSFEYLAAFRVKGRADRPATSLYLPAESADYFSPLIDSIARLLATGQPDGPVERTLLTTGVVSYLMESGYRGQQRVETPDLNISYRAAETSYFARQGPPDP